MSGPDLDLKELRRLETERDAWRRVAQDYTPGGSEFTTPQECAAYVRDLRERQHNLIASAIRDKRAAEEENRALREALADAVERLMSACDGSNWDADLRDERFRGYSLAMEAVTQIALDAQAALTAARALSPSCLSSTA